jgi:hypothetical protein
MRLPYPRPVPLVVIGLLSLLAVVAGRQLQDGAITGTFSRRLHQQVKTTDSIVGPTSGWACTYTGESNPPQDQCLQSNNTQFQLCVETGTVCT